MRSLILVALVACTRTVQAPTPATPKPEPNHARALCEAFLASPETKCIPWTGRETPYGGVDSMLAIAPGQVLYVATPIDGPPIIKVALQLESPPDAPKTEPPKKPAPPASSKPEPKKK